jgi:CSLREA domain-containing protein
MRRRAHTVAGLALFALLTWASPAPAAQTFTVNRLTDDGDGVCDATCTLRDAVQAANALPGTDQIVLPAGTLRLDQANAGGTPEDSNVSGDLDITDPVTIRGAGALATTIQSFVPDRVLDLHGDSTDVSLSDLGIAGGIGDGFGGGINAPDGDQLSLEHVYVHDNTVQFKDALFSFGGGIYKGTGSLIANDSTISNNGAGANQTAYGGGIFLETASAQLENDTIAGNSANSSGGGIHDDHPNAATLAFVTIVGNSAHNDGGGITDPRHFQMRSTVVADNTAPSAANCAVGAGQSQGGNVGDPACGFTVASDVQTADALLGPLAGATIPVMEPLPGSPVLDRGVGPCPATDARGVARPQGAACDSGAAELPVAGGAPKDTTAPGISNVSVTRKRFRVGPNPTALSARKTPVGTVFRYALSEAAQVTLKIERPTKGRKVGRSCKKATRKLRKKPSCTRYVAAGATIKRNGVAGANSIAFSGRIGRKALRPGSYRATLGATDAAGNKATVRRVSFKIVRR